MRLGLHALGIGAGAKRAVIDTVAVAAERYGFVTLWAGEHVVMVDKPASRYPYSADGRIAVPAAAERVGLIRRLCAETGRHPSELRLAASLAHPGADDAQALSELGIDELIVVASPPDDVAAVSDWMAGIAAQLAPDWPDAAQ